MKYILAPIVLLVLLFPTLALSEEITMICKFWDPNQYDGKTQTRYFRYVDPIVGFRKIYQRQDGEWVKWCRPNKEYYSKPCKLKITDRGAVLETFVQKEMTTNSPYDNLWKGDEVIQVVKYTLDFEFLKRRVELHLETPSGERVLEDLARREKWSCNLHKSPDE